jgi:glycosyltransferase involved in cell wall biosynthesis
VLAEFSDRAKILRQENQGPAAARNRAIERSKGELIAFIDSDDLWLKDKLKLQVAFMDDHPGTGLVHCNGWLVPGSRNVTDLDPDATFYRKRKPPCGEAAASRIMKTPVVTSHVLVRRKVLEEVGLFPEDLLVHEDVDLFLRMLEAGVKFGFVSRPLVIKRAFADSLALDKIRYILQAIEVQYRSFRRSPVLHSELKPAIILSHRLAAWALYLEGDRRHARTHCLKLLRLRPRSLRIFLAVLALTLPERLGRFYLKRVFPAGKLEKVWEW